MKLISIILYLLIINKINQKLKLLFLIYYFFTQYFNIFHLFYLIYYFFTLLDWVIPTGVFLFFKQEKDLLLFDCKFSHYITFFIGIKFLIVSISLVYVWKIT